MKAVNKLRCYWSKKEDDLMCHYPGGLDTRTDKNYLFYKVFPPEVTEELKSRGYDLTTLKFEISPLQGCQRFMSQKNACEQSLAADQNPPRDNSAATH